MNNTGIYLLKKNNETFTKLSKTNNIRQTYSTFKKEINNIQFISFDINSNSKCLSNLESFLLTLFSEFRLKKLKSNYLTEFIDIDINILKIVIKYLINNIYWFENNEFEYPKCENQIYSNLNKLIISNKILIDYIIKDLIEKLGINYPTPMEVENEEFQVYLDYSDLKYLINSFNFKI
tara:strand:+ start:97 stop:630 length:534 start_codon:yes stop_codon:yes gene_type:complete